MATDRSFANLWIWDRVGDRLPWYYSVSTNRMPAKYLIARRIPCEADLREASEEELWAEHGRLTEEFLDLSQAIRHGSVKLRDRPRAPVSLVDLSVELARRMLRHCNFCRWLCRVDRSLGAKHGTCQLESTSRVGSYFHHPGEELVFRGTRGSGTIFFTSCNLRCQFCVGASTLILTDRGPRRIEDLFAIAPFEIPLEVGHVRFPESLHTFRHDGRRVAVTKLFRHEYRGELITIETTVAPGLRVTPGHEILASTGSPAGLERVRASGISMAHWLVLPEIALQYAKTGRVDRAPRLVVPAAGGAAVLEEATLAATVDRVANGYLLVPVLRIRRTPFSGPMYNLEVDDPAHTYTANFLAIGNCQNGDISHDKDNGIQVTSRQLATMARQLRFEGCHNINWVGGEPTIHLHSIIEAISLLDAEATDPRDLAHAERAKSDYAFYAERRDQATFEGEFNAPQLWNSNFFMSEETMRLLRPLIDVWLPDFKFGSDKCSIFLSRTPWYWETVTRNHKMVYDWGEDVVVRHLIMPDHVDCCTKPVFDWIAANAPNALVNVMDQYHPDYACDPCSSQFDPRYRSLSRRPYEEEVLEAHEYARGLGLRFEEVTFEKARIVLPRWARVSG